MKKFLLTTFTTIAILIFILWLIFYFEIGKKEYTAEEWKAFSIEEASERLDTFIEQEGLNRSDFKGPYSSKDSYNPRGQTYLTCYKSETHFFCYNQGGDMDYGYPFSEVECNDSDCKWLKSQP